MNSYSWPALSQVLESKFHDTGTAFSNYKKNLVELTGLSLAFKQFFPVFFLYKEMNHLWTVFFVSSKTQAVIVPLCKAHHLKAVLFLIYSENSVRHCSHCTFDSSWLSQITDRKIFFQIKKLRGLDNYSPLHLEFVFVQDRLQWSSA